MFKQHNKHFYNDSIYVYKNVTKEQTTLLIHHQKVINKLDLYTLLQGIGYQQPEIIFENAHQATLHGELDREYYYFNKTYKLVIVKQPEIGIITTIIFLH